MAAPPTDGEIVVAAHFALLDTEQREFYRARDPAPPPRRIAVLRRRLR